MIHEIQKNILKKLVINKKSKFSSLKPRHIESNLFVYHLKKLIENGYIQNKNNKYILSPNGLKFIDKLSFETFEERIQPKIVTILCIEKNKNFLLYKRQKEPFIDHIGFPYGKIHLEEKLIDAAHRELEEKTRLKTKLKYRGHVYITVHKETELISEMLCHIFYGKSIKEDLQNNTLQEECFWGDLQKIEKKELIPGVKEIFQLLKKNRTHFFDEFFLNI